MQSSQAEITQQSQQKYIVSGNVDFSTAPDLLRQADTLFSTLSATENKSIVIDFSKVTECNSAALAWVLELVKSSRLKNLEVQFENLPTNLQTIAKAYGVEQEINRLMLKA
ncbi:MAG: STAS domain-containing protein [Gammaproteobacteria bacterium]|nr:STAS domain-containing protein [Gammaproteobacteria bacterium]